MSTPRPRREYSAEFRADAVRMVTELGKPRSQVARELELNVSTLGRWVATEIGTLGTGRGSARRAPDPESTDPHEMQREIRRLREENERLKSWEWRARELELKLAEVGAIAKVLPEQPLPFVTVRLISQASGQPCRFDRVRKLNLQSIFGSLPVLASRAGWPIGQYRARQRLHRS